MLAFLTFFSSTDSQQLESVFPKRILSFFPAKAVDGCSVFVSFLKTRKCGFTKTLTAIHRKKKSSKTTEKSWWCELLRAFHERA